MKGGDNMKEKGYAGKIKNTGTQIVKATHQVATPAKKGTVKTGSDLRVGKK
jgi:hypothetical protein